MLLLFLYFFFFSKKGSRGDNDMLIRKSIKRLSIDLSLSEFKKNVQNEHRRVPWIVMFGNSDCPPCRMAKMQLLPSAEKMINFTNIKYFPLDESDLSEQYNITYVPAFFVFYNKLHFQIYPNPRNYMGIYKAFFQAIGELIPIDDKLMHKANRKVILLTKHHASPEMYSKLFAMLSRYGINFYITTKRDSITRYSQNVKSGIIFVDGKNVHVYNGKKDFQEIADTAISFFNLLHNEL